MSARSQAHLAQNNFTAGEISASMLGRQDVQRYQNAAKRIENFMLAPQGGLFRRPGTRHVGDPQGKVRLIPFEFSTEQAYVLEFSDEEMRVYKDGGLVESAPGVPLVVASPYNAADLDDLRWTQSADVLYLVHPQYAPRKLSRTSHTNWTFTIFEPKDGPYLDINTDETLTITASAVTGTSITLTASDNLFFPEHVGSIWRLEEAVASRHLAWTRDVCYETGIEVVSNNLVYKLHGTNAPNSEPRRIGQSRWQSSVSWASNAYCHWGENVYQIDVAGTSGSNPPVHTSGTVVDGGRYWTYIAKRSGTKAPSHEEGIEDDGVLEWEFLHRGFGVVKITGYVSPTQVTASVLSRLPTSTLNGTRRWREGAWSDWQGWPSAVAFYGERLCFASTKKQPQTLWMSGTGDYEDFAPTDRGTEVLDTQAITITLASGQVNSIRWMTSQSVLLLGTTGGEWTIGPASGQKALSADNLKISQETVYGSDPVAAVRAGSATVFVQRGGVRARELIYNFEIDGFIAKDLNLLADHVLREGGGVRELAYQQEPFSIIWFLLNDGTLAACTYLRDQEVVGWTRHILGGQFQGSHARVESIAVIPGGENGEDQLWLAVKRTIDGGEAWSVEYMQALPWPKHPQDKDAFFYVDSGLDYVGSPTNTFAGLTHLEGETVAVWADNAAHPDRIVTSGAITLDRDVARVIAGLPYASRMTTLPADFQGQKGSIQGQVQRTNRVIFRLLNSLAFKYGDGSEADTQANFRAAYMPMDQSADLFTGDFFVLLDQSYVRLGTFTIEQSQPAPLNVLSVYTEITVYES